MKTNSFPPLMQTFETLRPKSVPSDIVMAPRCLQVYSTPVEPITDGALIPRQCFYVSIITSERHISHLLNYGCISRLFTHPLNHKTESGLSNALNKNTHTHTQSKTKTKKGYKEYNYSKEPKHCCCSYFFFQLQ